MSTASMSLQRVSRARGTYLVFAFVAVLLA